MKTKLFLLCAAAMTCLAFAGCEKDPATKGVELTGGSAKQTVYADENDGTGDVKFKTTGAWTSTVTEGAGTRANSDPDARAAADWVTIDPSSGSAAGSYTVKITLDDNFTGADRTATVTILSGGDTIEITVTQKAVTESGEIPTPPVQEVKVTGVEVQAELALEPGGKATLAAKVLPENATNKAVKWTSGNSAVATVSATGEVTAVGIGTTAITVTTEDGNKTATCTVVVAAKVVPVTGVSLDSNELKLEVGKKATLTATVLPAEATNKTVSWKSGSTAVATVSATGEVTAVAVGSATVTATTTDGGKTSTCTVTVSAPEQAELDVLTKIPDPVFLAYCKNAMVNGTTDGPNTYPAWDKDGNGKLSPEEAATVTTIYISDMEIASLAGIEYFTGLTDLVCNFNQLTSLDVSKNTALTLLSCVNNPQLTSLDVSKNTNLTIFWCHQNPLITSLDVSKNTKLTKFSCDNNGLTSIDVSKNTELTELYCYNNRLTSLDVSKNTALTTLYCSENQLSSLDVSKNTALEILRCADNQLTSLDVSKNTALTNLECFENQLTSLDVSKNTALKRLTCTNNQLTALDISECTALVFLYCWNNPGNGTTFPVTAWFDNNDIPTADFTPSGSGWTYNGATITINYQKAGSVLKPTESDVLTKIPDPVFLAYCKNAMVKGTIIFDPVTQERIEYPAWDTDGNGKLSPAEAAAVNVINLSATYDYPGNIASLEGIEYFTGLTDLRASINKLTQLDVSKNTALTTLHCNDNQLSVLNVSKNTALTELRCYVNELSSLDVSKNTALTNLQCNINELSSLDVSKNTALTILYCSDNPLSSLDVSKNTALTILYCGGNQLSSLDVSKNIALTNLACSGNQLSSLDLSKNTALITFSCYHNPGNWTIFPVKTWFDNNSIPEYFKTDIWTYNGATITVDYQKAE